MKRSLLAFGLILITTFSLKATHLMGGEITVMDLGNNQHMVTLIAYRDTVGIPMALTATFEFNGPSNQHFTSTVPYDSIISGNLLPMYPYGVEIYLFIDTVTLSTPGLWNISWMNCCRNGAIQNLSAPLSNNMLLQTSIEVGMASPNSTPFFLVPAAIFLPVNTPWQYNPLPFDPDGDSLYWSIDQPLHAINQPCAGYVNPSSDPNDPFRIDPVTGTISWTANNIGNFVASVMVDQYRNGQWIGEIRRDMQFIVVNPTQGYPIWNGLSVMPVDSNNQISFDVVAGSSFKIEMLATHTDPNRPVFMEAYSEVFKLPQSNASFSQTLTGNGNEVKGTFTWRATNSDVRKRPYLVVFRASDRYFTDDKTVKINLISSVGHPDFPLQGKLELYPNPATDKVYLDFSGSKGQSLSLSVYTLNGKHLLQRDLKAFEGQNIFILSTEHWQRGAYLISIKGSAGATFNEVLVIE